MLLDNSKFDFSDFNTLKNINVNNFSDYDLDYLRMQIKKNSESLDKSLEKLRNLSNKISSTENMEN